MLLQTVAASDIVRTSLITLWSGVAGYLPRLVAAVVIFLIGWLIAVLLGKAAYHIIRVLHVDNLLTRVGFRQAWEKSGYHLNSALVFYELVKWFFVVVFLMAATNILGLQEVTEFLRSVVVYLPNVIIAVIILLIGILVARFLENLVRASVKAAGLASANFLGTMTRWSVFIFALLVALDQLRIAQEVIRIIIIGFVSAISLAVGLSFGLGSTKHADELMDKLRRKVGE